MVEKCSSSSTDKKNQTIGLTLNLYLKHNYNNKWKTWCTGGHADKSCVNISFTQSDLPAPELSLSPFLFSFQTISQFQSSTEKHARVFMCKDVFSDRPEKGSKKKHIASWSLFRELSGQTHQDTWVVVPGSVQVFSSGLMIWGVMSNVAFTLMTGRALTHTHTVLFHFADQRLANGLLVNVVFKFHPSDKSESS